MVHLDGFGSVGNSRTLTTAFCLAALAMCAQAQVVVKGKVVHTMAGDSILDGVVVIENGKITAVGPQSEVKIPEGLPVIEAGWVTPGLIDAHSTVGFSGHLNVPADQDQLDRSEAIQPELRAIDAYNARERLIEWIRGFGVTTIHTGHAPGALISGQTMIAKLRGETVEEAVIVPCAMIAATLASPPGEGRGRAASDSKGPGTRARAAALLRQALLDAKAWQEKRDRAGDKEPPDRKLRHEALVRVLDKEVPLLVTADRHQDIQTALRIAREFDIRIVLDSAADAHSLIPEIMTAQVPVLVHPTMARPNGDRENLALDTATKLWEAGIPFAFQAGFEAYVPKTRVVLFEAAMAAANGLSHRDAMAAMTIESARLLGIDARVGSIEVGKDGDLALYDGDPFEWTTHCTATIIDGVSYPGEAR